MFVVYLYMYIYIYIYIHIWEVGSAPRNPAPREHFLVWTVEPSAASVTFQKFHRILQTHGAKTTTTKTPQVAARNECRSVLDVNSEAKRVQVHLV